MGFVVKHKNYIGLIAIVLIMVIVPEAYMKKTQDEISNTTSNVVSLASESAGETCKFPKSDEELRKLLSPEQYRIVRENGTEEPFKNKYWNNKKPGVYLDLVSGRPLFSSKDKFDSGTGWPSFTRPIYSASVRAKEDVSHGLVRKEVRSVASDSHLGHVFDDGPAESGGLRYCINSGSLKFVPLEDLEKEGLFYLTPLFELSDFKSVGMTPVSYALLGGGCFWGVEELIRKLDGVLDVEVGYGGGDVELPNYNIVKSGLSGHAEVVLVKFDPTKLEYSDLLSFFFRLHDPTTPNQQGNDIGTQYRSVIFYMSDLQKEVANQARNLASTSGRWKKPIVTELVPFKNYYRAEDYHQDYLQKDPTGYTCHFLRD